MELRYFDAHSHIQFDDYVQDRVELLAQMEKQGVGTIVVGVDAKSSTEALSLASAHPGKALFAAAGHHPNDTPLESFDETAIREVLSDPRTVAVGECGLDYFRPIDASEAVKRAQEELFRKHLALAAEYGKPLMIHGRPAKGSMDAYDDLLALLAEGKRTYGDALAAHIHFFVGDERIARKLFELDCTVSYTAVITFAREYDEVIRFAPRDRLLTETDSPYVAPKSRRGTRNDPLAVIEVVEALAGIRGEDVERVRETVLQNARRVFKLAVA